MVKLYRHIGTALMLLVATQARGTLRLQTEPAPPTEQRRDTNATMTAIFDADQAARQDWAHADIRKVMTEDAERRTAARELLDAGKLESAEDYYHAAFVFQHGQMPEDYLLAHTLAVVAVARGKQSATWIAAATLDRYLQAIGQKQIYGTQFTLPKGEPVSQEPYDRSLVSDALRAAMAVPSQADQHDRAAELEAQRSGD